MRIPFALWSGILAVLAYAGLVAMDYMNFGEIVLNGPNALKIAGAWVGLVIVMAVVSALRNAAVRPDGMPDDVAREIQRHPED
jgi:hypothetical protein